MFLMLWLTWWKLRNVWDDSQRRRVRRESDRHRCIMVRVEILVWSVELCYGETKKKIKLFSQSIGNLCSKFKHVMFFNERSQIESAVNRMERLRVWGDFFWKSTIVIAVTLIEVMQRGIWSVGNWRIIYCTYLRGWCTCLIHSISRIHGILW